MPVPKSALAVGPRVYLRKPRVDDATAFCAAVRASRSIHRRWMRPPMTAKGYAALLARSRRPQFETLFVCRVEDDAIVGVFDLSQIFHGIMQSAYLGYYVLAPYASRGYMRDGLDLTLHYAFRTLRLHRVESNIQPSNKRSLALVRGARFAREGYSPRYLKIDGRWRDHERWALLVEDWRRHDSRRR